MDVGRYRRPFAPDAFADETYRRVHAVSRYFDARIEHADRLPRRGGALLVGNHALLGIDSWAFFPELYRVLGRMPRGLGLRSLFDVPVLRDVLARVGAVPGERDLAVDLLRGGELCVCYPGGARDSMKSAHERYHLKWGDRVGFAQVAVLAGVPVIPFAGIGPDDVFPMLKVPARIPVRFIDPRTPAPIFLPVARRVPFRFWVGEPLQPPPADSSPAAIQAYAETVRSSLETLIADGLRARSASV